MEKLFSINADLVKVVLDDYLNDLAKCAEDYTDYPNLLDEFKKLNSENLSKIIEVAFSSSVEKEEDRFHHFAIIILPPIEITKDNEESILFEETEPYLNIAKENFYVFEKSQPIEKLTKLAPSIENTDRKFIVWIDEDGNPVIWGFGKLSNFDSYDFLQIKTFSFGKLILISFEKRYVLSILKTEKLNTEMRCFALSSNLNPNEIYKPEQNEAAKELPNESKPLDEFSKLLKMVGEHNATDWKYLYHRNFEELATKMRKHSHGGTLLITQETWQNSIQEDIPFKASSISQEVRNSMIEETNKTNQRIKEDEESSDSDELLNDTETMLKIIIERKSKLIDFLAQLTAVDGATLITKDFEIIAFGAKIKPINVDDKPKEIIVIEPFEDSQEEIKELANLGGTRHQSSAQFVYDQKDSVAIVASQDGKLSVMFWNKEKERVQIIQHAEYLFA